MKVVSGSLKINEPKSIHYIEKIIFHKKVKYKSKSWENDIALVRVRNIYSSTSIIYTIHFFFSLIIYFYVYLFFR